MDKATRIKHNILIAEYRGYVRTSSDKDFIFFEHPDGKGITMPAEYDMHRILSYPMLEANSMRFHHSWAWLMHIVDLIISTPSPEGPEYVENYAPVTFGQKNSEGQYMVRFRGFSLHKADTFIEAVYLAVVEFITVENKK